MHKSSNKTYFNYPYPYLITGKQPYRLSVIDYVRVYVVKFME